MQVDAYLQALAQQQGPAVRSDGQPTDLRMTRAGQLLTANWKTELILAGYGYNITVGGVSAGADVSLVIGGGDGTVVDSNQPEMIVGTPTGYYHIPLGFTCAIQANPDADADEQNIILFADETQAVAATGVTGTAATLNPLLDGGRSAASHGWHTVTGDVTTPVATIVLGYSTNQAAQVNGTGTVICTCRLDFDPSYPTILAGPCSVAACYGGTQAVTGMLSYYFAEVPAERFA